MAEKRGSQSIQVRTVKEEGEDPTLVLNQITGSSAKSTTLRVELDGHALTVDQSRYRRSCVLNI